MGVPYSVRELCVCGGQPEMGWASDNKICRQVHCTKCGRKGPMEVFMDLADNSWTHEMKKLKGTKK